MTIRPDRVLGIAISLPGIVPTRSTVTISLLAVAATFAVACAGVEIKRIDATGQASGPDGMRYYMPRPYVSVNEPFVVWAKTYAVRGELTVDGNYVSISDIPTELASLVKAQTAGTNQVLASSVLAVAEGVKHGNAQGEKEPDDKGKAPEPGQSPTPGGDNKPDPVTEKTGQLNLKVANDNSAFAITPLKRYFDILWLPDFSEQYVVMGSSGLGNASIAMQLGQGWSLQGIEASVDNSAINKIVLDLMREGSTMLTSLARTSLGIPATTGGAAQGQQPSTAKHEFSSGTPLSVKITRVRVAVPGVYPILKPSELSTADALILQDKNVAERILVPIPPLTSIAFNTYETLVIEAARAAGDSPLQLGQYIDTAPAKQSPEQKSDTAVKALESAINEVLKTDANNRWEVALTRTPDHYEAVVKKTGTPTISEAEMRKTIRKKVEAAGGVMDENAHITLK